MTPDELERKRTAERVTEHMRPSQPERGDQRGQDIGVLGKPERLRRVGRLTAPRRVPGDHAELV